MQSQQITQNFFINSGSNLQLGTPEYSTMVNLPKSTLQKRWTTAEGQSILLQWKANKFDRPFLESLVGKLYDHVDLRGINLAGEDLTRTDLKYIDFYGSNFENTKFIYADLSNSYLSESNIKGASFDWANMKGVFLDTVDFNSRTSFIGVNLSIINFTLAVLLEDSAKRQQRIISLKQKHKILAIVLEVTCDYGRSFTRFFTWCLGVILFFAIAYTFIPNSLNKNTFWDSIYFSALTFFTINFEIQPVSVWGKILVIIEAGIGYLMTALLVTILLRKTIGD